MSNLSPINQFFILVISLAFIYMVLKRIPIFDELFHLSYEKWLKALVGLIFSIGGILIYYKSKRN